MTEAIPQWVLLLLVLIGFLVIFVIIMALKIPQRTAQMLKIMIRVVWDVIP